MCRITYLSKSFPPIPHQSDGNPYVWFMADVPYLYTHEAFSTKPQVFELQLELFARFYVSYKRYLYTYT